MVYYGNNDWRDYLAHYGVLGMKWGVRKSDWRDSLGNGNPSRRIARKAQRDLNRGEKRRAKLIVKSTKTLRKASAVVAKSARRAGLLGLHGSNLKQGVDKKLDKNAAKYEKLRSKYLDNEKKRKALEQRTNSAVESLKKAGYRVGQTTELRSAGIGKSFVEGMTSGGVTLAAVNKYRIRAR